MATREDINSFAKTLVNLDRVINFVRFVNEEFARDIKPKQQKSSRPFNTGIWGGVTDRHFMFAVNPANSSAIIAPNPYTNRIVPVTV